MANRVIEMNRDGITEYLGNYDEYLEKKRLIEAGEEENAVSSTKTRTQLDKEKRLERLKRESAKALEMRVKELEAQIARCEERVAELEGAMADPATYQDANRAATVAREHKEAQQELEELYDEWTQTADML